jgi:hypothetical protein
MLVFSDGQQFKENAYNEPKRADQDGDTPLLNGQAVVRIYSKGHSSESDEKDLKDDNNCNNN